MKERPILFTGPMVRALLDERKTQTRRIFKLPGGAPTAGAFWDHTGWRPRVTEAGLQWTSVDGGSHHFMPMRNPFGLAGDRLWVKETFFPVHTVRHEPKFAATTVDFIYQADYLHPDRIIAPHHWRPSIFCGHAATRITLEITGVRVERLQAISEADAMAEGVRRTDFGEVVPPGAMSVDGGVTYHPFKGARVVGYHVGEARGPEHTFGSARMAYANLWENINGLGSWDLNPWVWVIEFRKVVS